MLPALATERLRLRPSAADDVSDLLALFGSAGVRRFLFDDAAPTAGDVVTMLAEWAALAPRGLGGWTLRPAGGAAGSPPLGCAALLPVGAVARYAPRLAGEVEPVLALAAPHRGRGVAGEALLALIGHAFGSLALPRLVAVAGRSNARSVRMLLRAGFTPDGEAPGAAHPMRLFCLQAASGASGSPVEERF
jgi:[ribosomal protein S5]-alanine N-acetyltransferase